MRYLLAICLLAAFLLGWLPAGLAVASLFALSLYRPRNPRRAGLYLRRGGSETPPASPGTNLATTSMTPLTIRVADYSSSSTAPGGRSAAPETLPWQLGESRHTAPTSSGAALAGRLGLLDLSAASEATRSMREALQRPPKPWPASEPPCGCPETAA